METKKFKGTQGEWIVVDKNTNGTKGFEIQYGTDGECVTDHVYTIEDAKLISNSPKMFEKLIECIRVLGNVQSPATPSRFLRNEIEELIEEITKTY